METNEFEKAFSDFLDHNEYEKAQTAVMEMVRLSFRAGWQAASGDPPSPHHIYNIVPKT